MWSYLPWRKGQNIIKKKKKGCLARQARINPPRAVVVQQIFMQKRDASIQTVYQENLQLNIK
jgi:hypothetical protein